MKIGIVTDIHSNILAIKEAVKKFDELGCEKILCSGDLIGIGPKPDETIQYLMDLENFISIRGNHENYPFYKFDSEMVDDEVSFYVWENEVLSESSKKYISYLPFRYDLEVEGVTITLIHYAINDDKTYQNFTLNPNKEDLEKMFQGIDSDIIIYGHDHSGSVLNFDGRYFINNGSLGCPMANTNLGKIGILEIENKKVSYERLDIEYEVDKVVKDLKKLDLPGMKALIKIFYGRDI